MCVSVCVTSEVINWIDTDGRNDLNQEMSGLMWGFLLPQHASYLRI